jgi:hypothetical protein
MDALQQMKAEEALLNQTIANADTILEPDPNPVDLRNVDEPMDLINKLPDSMIVNMTLEEQEHLIDTILSSDWNDSQRIINDLSQSFADAFERNLMARSPPASPHSSNPADRTRPLEYNADLDDQPSPARADTPPSPVRRRLVGPGKAFDTAITIDDDTPPIGRDSPARDPHRPTLFRKGVNTRWKNIVWEDLNKLKIVNIDTIRDPNNPQKWREIDAKKLVNRLISNAHYKLKAEPPKGYNTVLRWVSRHPDLAAHLGQNARRLFKDQYKGVKIPDQVDLRDNKPKRR